MAGEDPVAAWLARRQPPSPSPETDAGLAGTIFADPVRDFLIRRGLHPSETAEDRHPLATKIGRFASGVATPFRRFTDEAQATGAEAAALVRAGNLPGAFERVARPITRPMDALMRFASTGSMPEATPPEHDAAIAALETAGVPAGDLRAAYRKRDYLDLAGQVVGNAALMAAPHAAGRMIEPLVEPGIVAPRDVFENGNRRMRGPDRFLPPAPDQPGVPERAGGPFAPEPPQGGIAAVPPYGSDVTWQHPKGAPPPIDIAAWLDGRQDAAAPALPPTPAAAPVAASAPPAAAPRLVDGIDLDAERAKLLKGNFPPDVVDRILNDFLDGKSAPPSLERAASVGATVPPAATRVPPPVPAPRPHLDVPAEPVPVTPPATAAAPPESPVSSRPAPSEGDALWQATLEDARRQGYQGTDAELRAQFDQHAQSAQGLIGDMQDIAGDYAPSALMSEIRRLGGLRPFDREMGSGRQLRGDLASIVESFASPATHGHRGASSIFRTGGLGLDDLVQQLQQDPRWQGLDDRQLLEELDRTARRLNEDGYEVPTLQQAMHISGMRPGEPWWDAGATDVLDTGEAQPRLPGDVGEVRDAEVPTPREEAPFALDRQIAARPAPQQTDALATLLNGRSPEVGRTAGELPAPQAPTADQPVQPTVRPNIKDFLVKQLRYTPEEVDALGPEQAMAIGNRVRMHPDGIQAGIAEHAKPAPPAYRATDPGPNLGEDSLRVPADELATLLGIQDRRTAMQRTRVPAESVNVPRETIEPTGLKPRAAAERQATGEALTVKDRQLLGLPEPSPERAAPATQSEVALARSRMTADARTRAKLLDTPTPENLDQYVRLMGEAADRQAEREFKGGTSKEGTLRTHERSGEYLASGLGGLQQLYDRNPALFWTVMRTAGGALVGALTDKDDPLAGALAGGLAGAAAGPLWRVLRAKAPGVAVALRDTLPPALGGKEGAPIGSQVVRRPRDLSQDIGGLEQRVYGQPHRTVPDVWKEISPVLDDMQAAEREQPSTTPALFQFTRNMYGKEIIASLNAAAKAAREQGLGRRAAYLNEMAADFLGLPTVIERVVSDLTSGRVSPKQTKAMLHRVESALYLNLLGAALDTALTNRTQILLAYPQLGGEALLAGVRRARTPEGQAETRFLETDRPTDAPALARVPNRTLRKLADLVLSPLKASDTRNRKDVYLGAVFAARKQGLSPAQAHEWAMEVTAQTQGTPGELGNNPFHRHLGPLRMFTKYPQIWGQWLADAATHPDPGVRRRLVGYFLGFSAVGAITGISVTNLLFPRIVPSAAAFSAGKDVLGHLLGSADHTLGEDLDPRRGGKAGIGRYPAKVATELGHFARYGFGAHVDQKPDGTPRGEHSAYEGFLSLLGQETNRQAGDRAALDDAYAWIADRTRHHAIESRLSKQDLARAIEGGDTAGAADASKGLSHDQLRNFYRARQQSRYQQLLTRVPKAERAEFERRFRSRLLPGE